MKEMAINEPIEISLDESARARATRFRAKCPEAYALSVKEAVMLSKIDGIIWQFFDAHPEYNERDPQGGASYRYDSASVGLLRGIIKRQHISLDNAYKVAQRVLNSNWFMIQGVALSEDRLAALTTKEGVKLIERKDNTAFYTLWDAESVYITSEAEAARLSLSLDDSYKMLIPGEIDTLKIIQLLSEFTSEPVNVSQEGYISITSSPETTALSIIGKKALSTAIHDDDANLYEMTTAIGKVYLRDELLIEGVKWVSIDKLLRQINYKSWMGNHSSKVITISLDEFMEFRGIPQTRRKEARAELKEAINDLYNVSCEVSNGKIKARYRYIQAMAEIKNSRVDFKLADDFYEVLKEIKSIALTPISFMQLDERNPNTYKIAIYLSDNKRRNIGNANENKASIAKLLEQTSLPLASDIPSNKYKERIIDPFFKALDKAAATKEFTYTLIHRGDKPLTEHELIEVHYNYSLFKECLLLIQWLREPDYNEIRSKKIKEAEAREQARIRRAARKAKQ